MSGQPISHQAPPSAFKRILFTLSVTALTAIFLSCKPSAAPSSSPLSTPILNSTEIVLRQTLVAKVTAAIGENLTGIAPRLTSYPPSTKLPKPTPIGVGSETPEPTAFAPAFNITPAGAWEIDNTHRIPPFYTHGFIVENAWIRDTAGGTIRTFVYGGFIPGPGGEITQQGVVVVQVLKMDTHGNVSQIYYKEFLTPTQSGSIHITGAVGERLILQATNGALFYFDTPLRQFVPSLSWTPTPGAISPLATPTPAP